MADEQQTSDAGEEHPSEAEYAPPDRLPPPLETHSSFPIMSVVAGVGVALLGGVALFIAGQVFYVYILYNVLLGIAIGKAISFGLKHSSYTNRGVLFALALFCSFIAYLSFNCAFYVYVLGEVNEPQPTIGSIDWVRGLLAFVVVRAQNEPFIGGAQIGAVGNAIVWLIELAITQYTAHSRISQAVAIGRVESVPSEVTALVLHLLTAGQDTESVTRELAKRGWTNPADQERALQAVASLASLAEQASEEGEEGQ